MALSVKPGWLGEGGDQRGVRKQMTGFAIAVIFFQRFGGVGLAVLSLVLVFVLVAVVTKMAAAARFVLTIDSRRRPGELEGDDEQQQDQQDFFHQKGAGPVQRKDTAKAVATGAAFQIGTVRTNACRLGDLRLL